MLKRASSTLILKVALVVAVVTEPLINVDKGFVYVPASVKLGTVRVFVQTETKSITLHLFHFFSSYTPLATTVYVTALSIFYATFPFHCSELQSSGGK